MRETAGGGLRSGRRWDDRISIGRIDCRGYYVRISANFRLGQRRDSEGGTNGRIEQGIHVDLCFLERPEQNGRLWLFDERNQREQVVKHRSSFLQVDTLEIDWPGESEGRPTESEDGVDVGDPAGALGSAGAKKTRRGSKRAHATATML